MYLEHFSLLERPFATTPDPDFMVWADQYKHAQRVLIKGAFSSGTVTLLSGDIGCGKTTLLQFLLRDPDVQKRCDTILIAIRLAAPAELVQHLMQSLGIPTDACKDIEQAIAVITDKLAEIQSNGLTSLLIVDEAHLMSVDVALLLAKLARGADGRIPKLSIILAGQPELRTLINARELAPLRSVIDQQLTLGPLSRTQLEPFIRGRLKIAGASGSTVFDKGALDAIYDYSGGTPRLINKACELCLYSAAQMDLQIINAGFANDVLAHFAPPGGKSRVGKAANPLDDGLIETSNFETHRSLPPVPPSDLQGHQPPESEPQDIEPGEYAAVNAPKHSLKSDLKEDVVEAINTPEVPSVKARRGAFIGWAAALALCAAAPAGYWILSENDSLLSGILAGDATLPSTPETAANLTLSDLQTPPTEAAAPTEDQFLTEARRLFDLQATARGAALDLEALNLAISEAQTEKQSLHADLSAAQTEMNTLSSEIEMTAEELGALRAEVRDAQSARETLQVEISARQAKLERITEQIAHAEQKLEDFEAARKPEAAIATRASTPLISAVLGTAPVPDVRKTLKLAPLALAHEDAGQYFRAALESENAQDIAVNFARAALRGHRRAATFLGQLYETGDGVTFDPETAQRWYSVAQDTARLQAPDFASVDVAEALQIVAPMAAFASDGTAEFIWTGRAREFTVEVARADGHPIADARTSLTALRVDIPDNAALWRVKTDSGRSFDWQTLGLASQ